MGDGGDESRRAVGGAGAPVLEYRGPVRYREARQLPLVVRLTLGLVVVFPLAYVGTMGLLWGVVGLHAGALLLGCLSMAGAVLALKLVQKRWGGRGSG